MLEEHKESKEEIDIKEERKKKRFYESLSCEESLFIFSKSSFVRIWTFKITNYKHFENLILSLIVLSSLKLVFDTYLPDKVIFFIYLLY